MEVFTPDQIKAIEALLEKNAKKIAEYVLKDTNFLNKVKALAVEELHQRLKT